MTAKRKRPTVRYVASDYDGCDDVGLWSVRTKRDGSAICLGCFQHEAKRIAAALNAYEARRRGEL